jgi:HD-like signal output (HDOD) protein
MNYNRVSQLRLAPHASFDVTSSTPKHSLAEIDQPSLVPKKNQSNFSYDDILDTIKQHPALSGGIVLLIASWWYIRSSSA